MLVVAYRAPTVRPQRGFTLLEILAVVVILAIVAAMAVPMLGQTRRARLTAAAELLAADLNFAQLESIAHSDDPRLVVFDTVNHAYYIAALSAPDAPITNPVGKIPYRTQFGVGRAAESGGVTITALSLGGDNQLRFGAFGQIDQATLASITLSLDRIRLTISVDPVSGEVTVGSIMTATAQAAPAPVVAAPAPAEATPSPIEAVPARRIAAPIAASPF